MFVAISEGEPTYTAEQMFRLLEALAANLDKVNLNLLKDADEDTEIVVSSLGTRRADRDNYGGPSQTDYSVEQTFDPYTFEIHVRLLEWASQDQINGEYVTHRAYYSVQHDCWNINTQAYVERWYHTMWVRLGAIEPNIRTSID